MINILKQQAEAMQIQFELADLHEANLGMDKITVGPALFVMPPIVLDEAGPSGAWVGRYAPLFMYFLVRLGETTISKPKAEIWEEAAEPMRKLGLQYIGRLNRAGVLDIPATSAQFTSVYNLNDANLHGVLCQVELRFREGVAC